MGIQARSVRGRAVTSALVLATAMVSAGGAAASASAAAESATRAYWTASRMASASSADGIVVHMAAGAPANAPTSTHFDGVRTVGALFDTTGKQDHFCTASVVNS